MDTSKLKDALLGGVEIRRGRVPRIDRFFTWWALGAHALFALGLLPNTTLLAAVVLVGSEVVEHLWSSTPRLWMHLTFHYAPLLALLALTWGAVDLRLLPVLLVMAAYLTYHEWDVPRIIRFYQNIPAYVWSADDGEQPAPKAHTTLV